MQKKVNLRASEKSIVAKFNNLKLDIYQRP